jgi:hypothetical protein
METKTCSTCGKTCDIRSFKQIKGRRRKTGEYKVYISNQCYACLYVAEHGTRAITSSDVFVEEHERTCSECNETKPIEQFQIRAGQLRRDGTRKTYRLRFCNWCKGRRSRAGERKQAKRENPEMTFGAWRRRKTPSQAWGAVVARTRRGAILRGLDFDLSAAQLAELFSSTNGICPVTGWEMSVPATNGKILPTTASMDRLDHNKGYTIENTRLVAYQVNVARNIWSDDQLLDFCRAVLERNNPFERAIDKH